MGQAKLKFTFLLPERPKSWNYRYSKHADSVSTEGREEDEREGANSSQVENKRATERTQ